MLKAYKRRYRSSKFRNFTDVCQPRPQGAFLWLLPTSKASEKRPGDEVGRGWTFANGEGNKFSQTCRGYIFAHLRRIPFKIGKFTNIKALLQVVSLDFPFTWSRSTGPGRVSTLSVPGFHMQGHCNTRKIYTYFNKGCFGIWTFKHRIQCNALLK